MTNPNLQDALHEWQGEQGITDATMLTAQLEVIAEQLQTANLLAYLNVATQYRLAYTPSEAVLKSVQADVEVRLGLA